VDPAIAHGAAGRVMRTRIRAAKPHDDRTFVIRDARVFDGQASELVEADIRVEAGRIVEMGKHVRSPGPPEWRAAGRVVSPGLVDAHFHAYAVGLDPEELPLSYLALAAQHRLRAALARGFTTVRDVAGGDAGLELAIERGHLLSPRYLYTGAALSQTGGHGDPRGSLDACAPPTGGHTVEVVDGVDSLVRAVRERFRGGAHAIKIFTSGGVISPHDPLRAPQFSAEEVRAVAAEAERYGSYVAAHAYSSEAIAHSVLNGVHSIEHGNLLDPPTARLMADRDAVLVPTLAAYDSLRRRGTAIGLSDVSRAKNAEVLDAGRHAIECAAAAGVPVGFGTDLMGELEDDQLVGIRLQGEVMGALGALRSIMHTNRELCGPHAELRLMAPGAAADLVVWDGNPLEDLSVVWDERRARSVVLDGRLVTDQLGLA